MRGGEKGLIVGMKPPREGYRSSLRLQKQVAHLEELIQQEQQAREDTHARQMLLANAILLHRVSHEFQHPLYQQWAQEEDDSCDTECILDKKRLSKLPLVQSNPNWELLVQIATSTSNMTRRLLTVTPERVKELAKFTLEDALQLAKECSTGMVVLSELLRPARYPLGLLRPADQQPAAAEEGGQSVLTAGAMGGPTHSTSSTEEITEAAQLLLKRLEQYATLLNKLSVSVSVLLALQPTILIGMAGMDLETGKQRSPPAGHFKHAARRLGLTGPQITELRRIQDLSNRMVSSVKLTGMQLVGEMAGSFGVLASLSAGPSNGSQGVGPQGGPAQQQSAGSINLQRSGSLGSREQQDQSGLENAMLEKLMQEHVHNIQDFLLVVQGNWAINVLTPWQHGLFAAACWPFQASMGALVELAPVLTPDDSPPLVINADACPEAAAAAALAAELGYIGPQQAMQQRHDAMDAHLAWVLNELGLL